MSISKHNNVGINNNPLANSMTRNTGSYNARTTDILININSRWQSNIKVYK